jgi:alkaline phosphatase D
MKYSIYLIPLFLFIFLTRFSGGLLHAQDAANFTIAFGSCNKTDLPNLLWDDILNSHPDVFIWGGDNVYADTDDMKKLTRFYEDLNKVGGYMKLKESTPVIGTWDDHDYGMNDGGVHFKFKAASQQVFLDFMEVEKDSPRRKQEGVYAAHSFEVGGKSIKIIVLDTRYFRSDLTPDIESSKRNKPNPYGQGTILGEAQWNWLENTLKNSSATYHIIVSSIQFLSNEHGFECWGNFPHEVDKLEQLLVTTQAKNTIILSGDRHISEISKKNVPGLNYPLIDFTSSGLTHAYSKFKGEPNLFRASDVVFKESFGVVKFYTDKNRVLLEMISDGGLVEDSLKIDF